MTLPVLGWIPEIRSATKLVLQLTVDTHLPLTASCRQTKATSQRLSAALNVCWLTSLCP